LRAFFAGVADASGLASDGEMGLCAPTKAAPAKIIIETRRARFVVMKHRLEARALSSTLMCNEPLNGLPMSPICFLATKQRSDRRRESR
jgi:hypothetical protein